MDLFAARDAQVCDFVPGIWSGFIVSPRVMNWLAIEGGLEGFWRDFGRYVWCAATFWRCFGEVFCSFCWGLCLLGGCCFVVGFKLQMNSFGSIQKRITYRNTYRYINLPQLATMLFILCIFIKYDNGIIGIFKSIIKSPHKYMACASVQIKLNLPTNLRKKNDVI